MSIKMKTPEPEDRGSLLKLSEISTQFKVSKRTIQRWISADNFPKPLRLGHRTTRWYESDVLGFLTSRESK